MKLSKSQVQNRYKNSKSRVENLKLSKLPVKQSNRHSNNKSSLGLLQQRGTNLSKLAKSEHKRAGLKQALKKANNILKKRYGYDGRRP